MKKAFLILEDGFKLEGNLFGAENEVLGEVVFNTSMSGYQEIITDPSYAGQIMTFTYPMIGNYGISENDNESDKVQVSAIVVKEYSKNSSNFRSIQSLNDFLVQNNITGIEGIDTRKLTTHIRDKGALRGGIFFSDGEDSIQKILQHPKMDGLDLASVVVSGKDSYKLEDNFPLFLCVIDFGIKNSIIDQLKLQGFNIEVVPYNVFLRHVSDKNYDAFFLSNGPGDPAAVNGAREIVDYIVNSGKPAFGICLGHQILCNALGARTYKLKFGHRGGNHPVKDLSTGKVEITAQNHGFAVDSDSLKKLSKIEVSHLNLNDDTIEGIVHKKMPLFSVQYHPEAGPGPNDANYLFKRFYDMVVESKE